MKLLVQQLENGKTRVCSAACYDARPGSKCGCLCGSRNHGAGLEQALKNIEEIFLPMHKSGLGVADIEVTRAAQRRLRRDRHGFTNAAD